MHARFPAEAFSPRKPSSSRNLCKKGIAGRCIRLFPTKLMNTESFGLEVVIMSCGTLKMIG